MSQLLQIKSLNIQPLKSQSLDKERLRKAIIHSLTKQGFSLTTLFSKQETFMSKEKYKQLQEVASLEQQKKQSKMLLSTISTILPYMKNLDEINPDKIKLELIEIESGTLYEKIFKWWNLAWWSMPFQKAFGRQMRFLLWDTYHNAPFGLIGLQSPILKMSVRDKYLNISNEKLDFWINQSMNAQRIGALPPYNELIGGKMVSLALVSKEIRLAYKRKYKDTITILENRKIKSDLLFITTTSGFGRSSIYNRLKFDNKMIAKSLGYTKGFGSFHINDNLFKRIISYLKDEGIDTFRSYGGGPSKRIKLLNKAFKLLEIPGIEKHGLKREFFIFENVENLHGVLHNNEKPIYLDYKLD